MTRVVDLSMAVDADMVTFPRVPAPALLMYESWTEYATRTGAAEHGVDSLTATYLAVVNDHVGTHCDAVRHIVPTAGGPGIDAITFDPPVWAMFERRRFWEAHRVMNEEPYWHLENFCNLDRIGRAHGFKLALFPVKWVGTTAAPVRAVALVDDE